MFACLFDIDGTLLSSGGAGKHAMYAALASEFGLGEIDDGVPFAGRTDRAIGHDLFLRHNIDDTAINWQRFVRAYLGHLPDSLSSRPGRVLPGVADLLERLRSLSHVAIGLLTGNIRDGAQGKLQHYGISDYFAFGGFGDCHFDRNAVAHEALSQLRAHMQTELSAENVWVIGDTPLDVRCARSIGAHVLAVSTGLHTPEELAVESPDILVTELTQSEALLDAIT